MDPVTAGPTAASDPATWVEAHGDALLRYVLPRVRDRDAAEDLVQETFLAALAARPGFRGDAQERTWLIGILRHKLMDHLRRVCRERTRAGGGDEEEDGGDPVVDGLFDNTGHWKQLPGHWRDDPQLLAENREFWAVFSRCRGALPTRQAAAFTLRMLEDQDADAVCQELGVTPTNLWVLLHRARTRLRECLEAHWFGTEARP